MKVLIVGLALIILFTMFTIYQQDFNKYASVLEDLKYQADECSDSASLYYIMSDFSDGRKVFNQTEGIRAIEYMLKINMSLDDSLNPLPNMYWTEAIEYDAYFFDESNTVFPYLFTDARTGYTKAISEPTVIVTIDAGTPRFRLKFLIPPDAIRTSAYEYLER